jgi:hypothetical protein
VGSGEVTGSTTESASYSEWKTWCCNKCESGNVNVHWKNVKKCVLNTISDLIGKVEKKAGKPWITQKIIDKTD